MLLSCTLLPTVVGVGCDNQGTRRDEVAGDDVQAAPSEAGRRSDGPSGPSRKRFPRESEEDMEGGLVEDWGLDVDIIELHDDVVKSRREWRGKGKGRDGNVPRKSEALESNAPGPETLQSRAGVTRQQGWGAADP